MKGVLPSGIGWTPTQTLEYSYRSCKSRVALELRMQGRGAAIKSEFGKLATCRLFANTYKEDCPSLGCLVWNMLKALSYFLRQEQISVTDVPSNRPPGCYQSWKGYCRHLLGRSLPSESTEAVQISIKLKQIRCICRTHVVHIYVILVAGHKFFG